jgi:hypothetical protein
VATLNKNISLMSLKQVEDEYEELDQLSCRATVFAKDRCQKLRKGNVPFSPTLNGIRMILKARI